MNSKNTISNEEQVIDLTPEEIEKINKIMDIFGEMLVKHAKDSRIDKADGGRVDKTIYSTKPDKTIALLKTIRRNLMNDGGLVNDFPEDEEGQLRYFISVLDPPKDYYQAYLKEQLERDLDRLIKTRGK
jgi:hypothetical protein